MTARKAPLLLLVFLPALLLRAYPLTSESFQYDAIVSQMAAAEGPVANALDRGDTFRNRRYHPPLLSYIIELNNALTGGGEYGTRVFAMVFGAAACAMVAVSVASVSGGVAWPAVFAGWLLLLLPVHLYVSRTANWDAVYSFFSVTTLYLLSRYLQSPSLGRLIGAAIVGALAFLTAELGLLLLIPCLLVLFIDVGRMEATRALRWWGAALLAALVLVTLLWPAGTFKTDAALTLRFRIFDSSAAERNLPWTMFYVTLFKQSAGFVIAALAGVAYLVARHKDAARGSALLPFAVYVVAVFALSFKQRLVYLHHIADMFAPLAVVIGVAVAASAAGSVTRNRALGVLAVVVVLAGLPAVVQNNPEVVGPQEQPGLLGVRDFLADHPNAKTCFHYDRQMAYYAPAANISPTPDRKWTEVSLDFARSGDFDFIVADLSMFHESLGDINALQEALGESYRVVQVIPHRRTEQPVTWIFARAP